MYCLGFDATFGCRCNVPVLMNCSGVYGMFRGGGIVRVLIKCSGVDPMFRC